MDVEFAIMSILANKCFVESDNNLNISARNNTSLDKLIVSASD